MLKELRVSNFAIIQNLNLSFRFGLNILSGETGSGKSVLLKSLGLLMGEKSTSDLISDSSETASVEGLFDLSQRPDTLTKMKNLDIPIEHNSLIVRRVLNKEGSSRVYLNGSLSTLQTLREVVAPLVEVTHAEAPLIEMTGQHESKNLMSKAYHLDVLDRYCESSKIRKNYEALYSEWGEIKEQLRSLDGSAKDRDRKLDYLKFQHQQINELNLQVGEDETLRADIKARRSVVKMQALAQSCEEILVQDEDSAQTRIQRASKICQDLSKLSEHAEAWSNRLNELSIQLEDCVFQMRTHTQELESDDQTMSQLEDRLSQIRSLQKLYGTSIEEILAQKDQLAQDIQDLEDLEARIEHLTKAEQKTLAQLEILGRDLSKLRVHGAKKLQTAVNEQLEELNMRGVQILVNIETSDEPGPSGYDSAELFLQSSAKAQARPLKKVASGGELSRVLLALKCVSDEPQQPRTFLFDEVDSGVSGVTAQLVGKKLKAIAGGQQVICVTHLPQVAAYADHHFYIFKTIQGGAPQMSVQHLSEVDRVQELARLLSGKSITNTALGNAKELLTEAKNTLQKDHKKKSPKKKSLEASP